MNQTVALKIIGKCMRTDEELFGHMEAAIARGLPEITKAGDPKEGVIAIVASGPSVEKQLATIKEMQHAGTLLVAVKDAHDWLIGNGIIPEYAFAIDPQAHRWNCFTLKNPRVHYMLASQCHAAVFDHLKDMRVTIWHPYIHKGQTRPKDRMVIGGGTTSGMRAIGVFYVLGWRHFALFGFDSCLDGERLRVNGSGIKPGDQIIEVKIDPDSDEVFHCNPAMALQAEHFQILYDYLPDAQFYPYGEGLIPAIIRKRQKYIDELARIEREPRINNDRISFIHSWNQDAASYRYRAQIPARELHAALNDYSAGTLIFAKPQARELMPMARAKARGAWIVADFCDDHLDWTHYQEFLRMAHVVTCPTATMAAIIKENGRDAIVIPDPSEYGVRPAHCRGVHLLWFGHAVNKASLDRILPELEGYSLRVVGNWPGAIPWSQARMVKEFGQADIVILPATEPYKSANRAVEAIRQGCFVVAEDHPAWHDIPGIWIGNIKEGIEWARLHTKEANRRLSLAQKYVTEKYAPRTVAAAWKSTIQRPITSDAAPATGMVGSMSI